MIKISNNPMLINRMPYGKHKGMWFTKITLDYLQWLLTTKLDVDAGCFKCALSLFGDFPPVQLPKASNLSPVPHLRSPVAV